MSWDTEQTSIAYMHVYMYVYTLYILIKAQRVKEGHCDSFLNLALSCFRALKPVSNYYAVLVRICDCVCLQFV